MTFMQQKRSEFIKSPNGYKSSNRHFCTILEAQVIYYTNLGRESDWYGKPSPQLKLRRAATGNFSNHPPIIFSIN